ncbi:flagellar filament capping protein FliD [Pseudomonas sp.]|uniref:flagellar filament capping protein FliD n=1 Tax=Pseudomonas sp. TaxID=306 RepID=UPI00272C5B88|nr:flagellar filament capping protein FliD [Pseudomonas sp.]
MDIKGIVSALVNAESAPKSAQLNRLEKATTAKFSGLGQFRSALSSFQSVLKDLNNPSLFEKRSASSGKADIFSVTANAKATAGNSSVQVFNIAQTSKVALRGVENATDPIGTGTLRISAGDSEISVSVTPENNSLSGIRDAINAAGRGKGLSATIVSDPGGNGGARLVLSSDKSGTGNDIVVEVETQASDSGTLAQLAFTPPATVDFKPGEVNPDAPAEPRVISYARDARLAIDGITINSATNVITDAIEGVTLTLKSAQSPEEIERASTINLNVSEDRAGVKSSIQKFVDAYNKLLGTVGSLTVVTPVGGDDSKPVTGALVGDSSVRSFMSSMRSELGAPVNSGGELRILADLGITTQRDGTLKLDDAKLDAVMRNSFDQLSGMLTGSDGLMAKLESKVAPYTQTGGILDGRTKALQNTLSGLDAQREQLTRRVAKLETRLLAQFNAMDALVGQLSGTSEFLAGALANLPGVVRQDKK